MSSASCSRSAEVSLLLVGQMAAAAPLKPEPGNCFISTGLSLAQSPVEAGLTVTNGFRAANSASAASRKLTPRRMPQATKASSSYRPMTLKA